MKFTIEEFLGKLPLSANEKWKDRVFDVEPVQKGNVRLIFFAPRGTNCQTSHDEDEFYFIARGASKLIIEEKRVSFQAGDAFFFCQSRTSL